MFIKTIYNMKKNRIRLTESDLHRIIKESVKRVLKENINGSQREFPSDFTENDTNQIDFGDHMVVYQVSEGNGNILDEYGEYWLWNVTIWPEDGKGLSDTAVQYPEDSAKWTFYELYEKLCKRLGIVPANMR